MEEPRAVILLFASGKLVCTGARKEEDVHRAISKLHQKLEEKKLISARWRLAENGRQRKYYRLTAKGHKALAANFNQWQMLTSVMGKVLGSAERLLPEAQLKVSII